MSVFLLLVMSNFQSISQRIGIDTKEIEPVIREWNYANNSRSVESFQNVYSGLLLFYTQTLPESKAIELKQKLFKLKPYFRQRIISDLRYLPYTSGIIKVDFTKEVLEKQGWKEYPSYVLVSYEDNQYRIVGESDYHTDKTLKYQLEIGEPMDFGNLAENRESVPADSLQFKTSSAGKPDLEAIMKSLKSGDWLAIFAPFSSMEMISVPKGHVFILIGMLAVGGLMIFIAESAQTRKRKTGLLIHRGAPLQNEVAIQNGVSFRKGDTADNVVREFKMQSVFEAFVITLFDPLYFRHRRLRAKKVFAGKASDGEAVPDLEFEFNHKEVHVRFAIQCLYYKNRGARELQLFSLQRQQVFRSFEEEQQVEIYYILGIGGTPDDPKELYLVPAKAVRSEFVRKEALKPFWKSGMFFYNNASRKLQ
jgi:hypothetical protein